MNDRFVLQKSTQHPGSWVLSDKQNGVVVKFEEHKFNDTQQVTMLEDFDGSAEDAARIMREIGDYLVHHHSDIIF